CDRALPNEVLMSIRLPATAAGLLIGSTVARNSGLRSLRTEWRRATFLGVRVQSKARMNDELQVLRDVSDRLSSAGIEFMVTGSVAMNYYAEPRMTRDIDLVIALEEGDADGVVRLFEGDYYIDQQAVRRAISRHSLFNLIHNESIIKVDCIILKPQRYRQEE